MSLDFECTQKYILNLQLFKNSFFKRKPTKFIIIVIVIIIQTFYI